MRDQEHQPEASHGSKRGRCKNGTCCIPDPRAQHKDKHDEHDRKGSQHSGGGWTERGTQSKYAGNEKGNGKRSPRKVIVRKTMVAALAAKLPRALVDTNEASCVKERKT